MAASKGKPGDRVRLESGPWRAVRTTPNPFDDQAPDELSGAVNCYLADPYRGGGAFQRPGATRPASLTASATRGGHMHVALDGTVYNFVFFLTAGGTKVYRWDSMGAVLTDVTPLNVVISLTNPLYAISLGGEMIVTDGVNKPWRGTNLGSTPITATVIEQQDATTDLSIGSNDVRLANAAFSYTLRAGGSIGTQATFAANAVGTAIGALGQIAIGTWGSILVELNSSAALVFTAAFNAGAGYASQALAIAALPARTATRWFVGYVTVQADAGAVWIAGTDAFQGGSTGNQAQTTNYYAGEGPAYSVFGQPWIYTGSLFWIYEQVEGVYARTTFGWSEPNEPAVGYQQTDYDNQWTYTQTGSTPLYAGIGTNDAIYLFRELSIGAVAGTPGVNFQSTATHDVVSGNVGSTCPRSILLFRNTIYFADQNGRPYRFPVGGTPEPLWLQAQSIFDATTISTDQILLPWAVLEPNLNLYILNYRDQTDTNVMLVFDAVTGNYGGVWVIGGEIMMFGAVFRDAPNTSSGNVSVGFFQLPAGTTYAWKLGIVPDNVWADNGTPMANVGITSGKMNYSLSINHTVDKALAVVGYATGASPTVTLTLGTSQRASVSFGNGSYPATPPELPLYRMWWSAPQSVQGRDVTMTLAVSAPARQTRFFKMAADAVLSETTPEDW